MLRNFAVYPALSCFAYRQVQHQHSPHLSFSVIEKERFAVAQLQRKVICNIQATAVCIRFRVTDR
ncbi:hypothetical protein C7N43_25095 [Sphingobacteriales bacterium UPWRP_1]|nr:hypothetical protein BVG80_17210 [Sphingobacteriales bacterium TSM_CSM]PSJ74237.1 hypothetical protein C7N43_25095 [Sphingobacteriales bacterium UPWRP_1]